MKKLLLPVCALFLTVAFIAGPIVFVMLGGACVIGWRLDAKRQGEIRGALDARDAQLAAAAGPSS